ncbi:MAG: hypothetical protein A2015_03485 [Spirochaetes bacterium GWF1_31_7]|nr:MAG: hypothetical protein A2Y30_07570 [Spirochaetes bacterium GWE1_32_154]OHD48442.1 MAG: hypothetical protein A2Y29_05445 [Spirochaetes bacterium GWE2_31_10]OHD50919.1 MAG: hypothetical protein A2015_03485 [Spirochaetes bacterium GWF1_31_7]OHD80511.1 MAG: hypothetical protein A2355_01605 [Spirochaetes bacterium RIFOXYB1_FULL_32_8]HBD92871.1 hypothetical protein [Spirochaetia bacterium]
MNLDYNENIDNLRDLEDTDISVKKKIKKNHKIADDDNFYRVKTVYNQYSYIFRSKNTDIPRGTILIVPTQYGNEVGICQGKTTNIDEISYQDELTDIVRIANEKDKAKHSENIKKEEKAYELTIKKIAEHKLEMKLINVHYFLEDSKILFNFTSDGRVDFRELVKDLASIFKTRIELRQIGVRDECRIIGSYGQCGKKLCCSGTLNELTPITIKMAKEQNITLNSLKISGTCGRLLCCLSYENETYTEEKKAYPREGTKVFVNDELFILVEINIQSKKLKLLSEEHRERFIYISKNDLSFDKSKNMYIANLNH